MRDSNDTTRSGESVPKQPGRGEFIVLIALMISIVAMAIDAMLPALGQIGEDMGVAGGNRQQLVVTFLFLGLAFSQIVFGPLSDSFGRKPVIYAGFIIFMIGCVMSIVATSFWVMLAGRLLQGIGAAGPRIVTLALVRDRFGGREMAQLMSLVMTVFILIPVFAPIVGQGIMMVTHWRGIFVMFLVLAAIAFVWFWVRQPETLAPEKRSKLSAGRIARAFRETLTNRTALGYTVTAGLIFGAFIGYLVSAQQIFQVTFGVGEAFPLYFAVSAGALGFASITNARLVMRFGMRPLTGVALAAASLLSIVFLVVVVLAGNHPSLWATMVYIVVTFFFVGFVFGNFNALAMEPLGHIAGSASSVIGSVTLLISLALGTLIGQLYDGTVLPLVAGFAVLATVSFAVMMWVERTLPWNAQD
ncbi:MAG: multidrug effflux MFS transporter [Pseudomonadota bacterium]